MGLTHLNLLPYLDITAGSKCDSWCGQEIVDNEWI